MIALNSLKCSSGQPDLRIQRFFQAIDWLAEATGHSTPAIVNLDRLRSLPIGSFGRAWADSLDRFNLKPITTGPRRKQLHDGIHVLTGYGVDPLGEAEVQAFLLGAKFRLVNLFLGLGLLNALRHQTLRHKGQQGHGLTPATIKSRLWTAYQRGRQSVFDPDAWQPESLWDLPLETVQHWFGVYEDKGHLST